MIVANNGLGLNMNMIHTTSAPQLRPFHCLDFSVKKSNSLSFVLGCWTSNSASPSKNKNSKNPKSFCCLCSNSNNSDTNNNNNNSSCLGWDWNRGTRHFSEIEQAESYASVLKPQPHMRRHSKLMEFPHLSASHKELMAGIISALETRLQSELLPSSVVPPDVEYYQNETGLSQGTVHIRRGLQSSHIDFMLASWLHLQQPNGGGAMNVTNLQVYLKPSINVPHFQLELVQCTPSYMIFFVDLTPRKDLVLNPDYLKTFYEETQLDVYRQKLNQVPEIKPYFSSSLYFRGVVSPTGILVSIKCEDGDGGKDRCEEIIRENVSPIAYEVMRIWMDKYLYFVGERMSVSEIERGEMEKRDGLIKRRAIEMDLSLMMPKQFGDEVGNRVLGFIKDVFNV